VTDIEIARKCSIKNIKDIASVLNINEDYLEYYGKYKAKINLNIMKDIENNKDGKLILVTSVNPTPFGEGKTTMSIGIDDALRKLNYNSLAVLREPSLGPVFGIKGGATGGGYSQVIPMEDINLHFTGDMHAITAANNLLSAVIDNHLFQGNSLNIDKDNILFNRCLDINDRSLRNVIVGQGLKKDVAHDNHFNITVASEVMAILCLARDLDDLKDKISHMLVAYDIFGKPIFVKDLHVEEAMTILLKDAINPNLVQTLEGNPVIIHGGPFANIAHGCNSLIATKMGLKMADYVVTEAGFGADLGAEKFLDIKCRLGNLKPSVIVINVTVRALKYNGGVDKEKINEKNMECLKNGICNLKVHISNMKKYLDNIIICINKFDLDSDEEIEYISNYVKDLGCEVAISTSYSVGGIGATELAQKIVNLSKEEKAFHFMYDINDNIKAKVEKLSKEIYHAGKVNYSDLALENIKKIENMHLDKLPICVAKTQYSISDDPKKLGYPKDYEIMVRDVKVNSGAGFIVIYMGNIMTMPGLSKTPAYLNMHIDSYGNISGLF
jgi:formate--tetrahydrofolate ligase